MGYYTLYRIRIINEYSPKENLEELKGYIEKISGYTFDMSGSVIYSEKIKWYSSKYHMNLVSLFFPEYEIQLKGKGEEGEVWEVIFKMGNIILMIIQSFMMMNLNLMMRKKYL